MRIVVSNSSTGDCTSLSEAVERAVPGAVIIVAPGEYVEKACPILITKSLTICAACTLDHPGVGSRVIIMPTPRQLDEPPSSGAPSPLMSSSLAKPLPVPAIPTGVIPKDSILTNVEDFPLVIPKESLHFKLGQENLVPIDQPIQESIIFTSKAKDRVIFSLFQHSCHKFDLDFQPKTKELKPGKKAQIIATIIVKCTTIIDELIPVVVEGARGEHYHMFIPLKMKSRMTTKLDLNEIQRFEPPLGEGTIGTVFRGTYREAPAAIKVLKSPPTDEMALHEFKRDFEMLEQLHVPNILKFIGSVLHPPSVSLVFEFAKHGNLEAILSKSELPPLLKVRIALDCAQGVSILHRNGILHRNLKPTNILIFAVEPTAEIVAKICDFEIAYTAPEAFHDGTQFCPASDVYSFGMVMYRLFAGIPFAGPDFRKITQIIQFVEEGKRLLLTSANCPKTVSDLITKCWSGDLSVRPSFSRILQILETEQLALNKTAFEASGTVQQPENSLFVVQGAKISIKGLVLRGTVMVTNRGDLTANECHIASVQASGKGSSLSLCRCNISPTTYGSIPSISAIRFADSAAGKVELCDIQACATSGTGIEICGESDPLITSSAIREGQVGITTWDNGKGKIENCTITNIALIGIEIARGSTPTIKACSICESQALGISIHNGGKGKIKYCNIFMNARGGIDIQGCSSPTIKGCSIHRNERAGITMSGASQAKILECNIFENKLSGIRIQHGSMPIITRCWLHRNKLPGLVVESDSTAVVQQCTVFNGEQAGMYFCNNGHGDVEQCLIYSNALAGIEIATDADPVIHLCTIDGNRKYGIHYREHGRGRIESCTISRSSSINVHITGNSDPIIRDCRIIDSGGAGVFFNQSGGATLESCDICCSGMANVEAAKECAPTVRSCLIHDGRETGLRFDRGAGGLIEMCDIYRNSLVGIAVRNGASPIIRKCSVHHGIQSGILLTSCGGSTLIDACDIHSNAMGGVELTRDSSPIIRGCNVHSCTLAGLQYLDNAGGTLIDCKIYENGSITHPQGLEIESPGPTITNCNIDGQVITAQQRSDANSQINQLQQLFFSYEEIEAATEAFNEKGKLGSGSYGTVFRAVINGTAVAIKVINLSHKPGGKKGFEHEIQLLSTFRHRNLVPLIGCSIETERIALVYDLMEGGSLKELLKKAHRAFRSSKKSRDLLPWSSRLNIAIGCARGLLFLHATARPPVIHRDFKSANVLLDRHNEPRIGDFGLARLLPDTSQQASSVAGTPGYICPEYASSGTLSTKVDVWSFGVVLLELLTGLPARIHLEDKSKVSLGDWLAARIAELQKKGEDNPLAPFLDSVWPRQITEGFYEIAKQCLISTQAPRPGMVTVLPQLEALEAITVTEPTNTMASQTGDP
ncbi:AAA family ATPase [Pelomyxa schiedti]|nr:AAA family ATPase [Pelomyxa schiedti]